MYVNTVECVDVHAESVAAKAPAQADPAQQRRVEAEAKKKEAAAARQRAKQEADEKKEQARLVLLFTVTPCGARALRSVCIAQVFC